MHQPRPVHRADALRVACLAVCDRRTVLRYLDGRPVTAASAARIDRALRDLDLSLPNGTTR